MASINGNDIDAFRAKHYIPPINGSSDLNQKSEDVISVVGKLHDLEKKAFDILNTVPDNNATCSIQVKYSIKGIIQRTKKQLNNCIVNNANQENRLELNVRKKFYFLKQTVFSSRIFLILNRLIWIVH